MHKKKGFFWFLTTILKRRDIILHCPNCHNENLKYFFVKNNKLYCKRCLKFYKTNSVNKKTSNYQSIKAQINYSLTDVQLKASNEILSYLQKKESVIVNAVCGAGKTELVYASIEYFLNQNKKVAFAIPRKEVVIEIYNRLSKDYSMVNVICVYGGHNKILDGDLVVLTTHQLYHYRQYFDLIILDEADAFPYYNNDLLEYFLKRASKELFVYLSATIKDTYLKKCSNIVYVNRRFHQYDLPIPKIIFIPSLFDVYYLKLKIQYFVKQNKPLLIFVPTIKWGLYLQKILKIDFVYSSKENKKEILQNFLNGKINLLITTSILERGMTIENIQVIVYKANHNLFDTSSLIQICGRVGRKKKYPNGEIIYICNKITNSIKQSYRELKRKNQTNV